MKLISRTLTGAALVAATIFAPLFSQAEDMMMVPTTAVLPFDSRGRQAEGSDGKSIAELVSISLMENGVADMVERAELDKALDELNLSATGMTDKDAQVQLGKLIGAKILITGSAFRNGEQNFLTAKIIGTETSRVLACKVSGTQSYLDMVPELAEKISAMLEKNAEKLLPKIPTQAGVLDTLKASVKGKDRKIYIKVTENINASVPDPAAETSLKELALALGFDVVAKREAADFAVIGEAVASSAGSYNKFASAESRVELSVFNKEQKLLATGSVRDTLAGATYVVAAKEAIAQGALRLARDVFPVMK